MGALYTNGREDERLFDPSAIPLFERVVDFCGEISLARIRKDSHTLEYMRTRSFWKGIMIVVCHLYAMIGVRGEN